MRKTFASAAWLAACSLAWWGLRAWVPGTAERFYFLLTPTSFALAVWLGPTVLAGLKTHTRRVVLVYLTALVLCVLYGVFLARSARMPVAGIWPEVAVFACLLTSALLILIGCQTLFRIFVGALARRWLPAGRGREAAVIGLSLMLLVAVAVPYLLGLMYVFRFKVPDLPDPGSVTARPFEDVSFTTDDGLTLRGWYFPCTDRLAARTLLICHGLGQNRSIFLPYLRVGEELHANVLMFDFRGHGDSDGHTVTLGGREALDVLGAVRYLRTTRPGQCRELIGLGISMGAASLSRAAARVEPPFDAVILDSSFAAAGELTDNALDVVPAAVRPWLTGPGVPIANLHAGCALDEVRPEDAVGLLRAPVLILHADGDELVPPSHAYRLYARARRPKTFWLARTGGHGSALAGALPQYLDAVRELVEPGASSAVVRRP